MRLEQIAKALRGYALELERLHASSEARSLNAFADLLEQLKQFTAPKFLQGAK